MTKKRFISIFLAVFLTLSIIAAPVQAASDENGGEEPEKYTIHIDSVEDLRDLSRSCRLNTYSKDLEVILDCSLDLFGEEFTPVPSFSGTFKGCGYTISGLTLSVTGDSEGLFRRIEPDGMVENLNVRADITASSESSRVGGIAGTNLGIIHSSTFKGTIYGQEETGGICGHNEGVILKCESSGNISGMKKTGGICGSNSGTIAGCTNRAGINTEIREEEMKTTEISALSLLGLVTADNVNSTIDTGGVAGYSDKILLRCENYGTVGYSGYGYNVGGIAGRQSNCMSKCVNRGPVYGRNDVGGIVGQAEPYMLLKDRQTLADEIRALSEAFDYAMDRLEDNSDITQAYINNVGESFITLGKTYDTAVDDAGYYDDLEKKAKRRGVELDISGSILEADISGEQLSSYESLIDDVRDATGVGSDAIHNVDGEKVRQIIGEAQNNGDSREGIEKTVTEAGYITGTDTEDLVNRANDRVNDATDFAREKVNERTGDAEKDEKKDKWKNLIDNLADGDFSSSDYDDVMDFAENDGPGAVYDSADWISVRRAENKEAEKEQQKSLDADTRKIVDDTNSLEDSIAGLGEAVSRSAGALADDMSVFNTHMTNALNMIANALSGNLGYNLYNDISELNGNGSNNGKISECENEGYVEGETNVGGIAGSMSIESEYDLEGVIADTLSSEGIFSNTYNTTCVIEKCINRADMKSTKSCSGGVTGNQGIGYMYLDENYGDVTAHEEYAGGVAGKSDAVINTCYSSCDVCSRSYAGGIAGSGTVILDCITLATIPESVTTLRGAIAGWADVKATRSVDLETGILAETIEALLPALLEGDDNRSNVTKIDRKCISGNFFVSDNLGGINGISYEGVAEPVSYSTVMRFVGLPESLKTKTYIFRAEGVTVKELQIRYGSSVSESDIPPVPEKEGYSGFWPEFDMTEIVEGGIIEAYYLPQLTVVESAQTREGTGTGITLLEGQFPVGTTLRLERCASEDLPAGSVFEAWSVSPEGKGSDCSYTIRYNVPVSAGDRFSIYVLRNGSWHKTRYTRIGSYISFEGGTGVTSFAIAEGSSYAREAGIYMVFVGIACASAAGLVMKRRKEGDRD